MSNLQQELIGTKEASELIDESVKNTIRRVERKELIPVTKLPGLRGAYLFDRAEVEAIAKRASDLTGARGGDAA